MRIVEASTKRASLLHQLRKRRFFVAYTTTAEDVRGLIFNGLSWELFRKSDGKSAAVIKNVEIEREEKAVC